MSSGFRCIAAGKYPTEKERVTQVYQDFGNGLGRERMAKMRKEVAHNQPGVPSVHTA